MSDPNVNLLVDAIAFCARPDECETTQAMENMSKAAATYVEALHRYVALPDGVRLALLTRA